MIPSMTSPEEHELFYNLAKAQNQYGFVLELGTWLGASTIAIAEGIRDSGHPHRKAHVYDRFIWNKKMHAHKATLKHKTMFEDFRENLGPLFEYIIPHRGDITRMEWSKGDISLIIFDAPKRIKTISPVLTALTNYIYAGTILVWQDFTHVASFEIPLACSNLDLELINTVPGSTGVFRVTTPWLRRDVTPEALSRKGNVDESWQKWLPMLNPEMAGNLITARVLIRDGR